MGKYKKSRNFRHGPIIFRIQRTYLMHFYIIYALCARNFPPQEHHLDKQDSRRKVRAE